MPLPFNTGGGWRNHFLLPFEAAFPGQPLRRSFLEIVCRFARQISPCLWAGKCVRPLKTNNRRLRLVRTINF